MALVHGKAAVFTLDTDDLSDYTDTVEEKRDADEHDTTTHGSAQTTNGHAFKGGLRKGSITIGGLYESGATGPGAVIRPLIGTNVAFTHQPEGPGTGKPQSAGTVHVKSYTQTEPVADYIRWTAELTVDGYFTDTTLS